MEHEEPLDSCVLMQFFAHMGLPHEILTDRGSPFMATNLR